MVGEQIGGYRAPRVGLAATVRDSGRSKSPASVANKYPFADRLKGLVTAFWVGKASHDFAPPTSSRTEIIEGRRGRSDHTFSPILGSGNSFPLRRRRGVVALRHGRTALHRMTDAGAVDRLDPFG